MRIDQAVQHGFDTITDRLFGWTDRYPDNRLVRQIPNLLSISRFAIPILIWRFYYAVRAGNHAQMWAIFAASFILGLTDGIDGPLARRMRVESVLGSVLDHVGDKLAVLAFLTCWPILVVKTVPPGNPSLIVDACFTVVAFMIIFELLIAVVNSTQRERWSNGANQVGRIKMGVQGLAFLVATIGLCTSYHHQHALAGYTWASVGILVIALLLALLSLEQYINPGPPVPPPASIPPPPEHRPQLRAVGSNRTESQRPRHGRGGRSGPPKRAA